MGLSGYPEISVSNYHCVLRRSPGERNSAYSLFILLEGYESKIHSMNAIRVTPNYILFSHRNSYIWSWNVVLVVARYSNLLLASFVMSAAIPTGPHQTRIVGTVVMFLSLCDRKALRDSLFNYLSFSPFTHSAFCLQNQGWTNRKFKKHVHHLSFQIQGMYFL
jgi:hypothetical protein